MCWSNPRLTKTQLVPALGEPTVYCAASRDAAKVRKHCVWQEWLLCALVSTSTRMARGSEFRRNPREGVEKIFGGRLIYPPPFFFPIT